LKDLNGFAILESLAISDPKAYPPPYKEAVKTSMRNFPLFPFGFPLVLGAFLK
jgi:hypothetical protein